MKKYYQLYMNIKMTRLELFDKDFKAASILALPPSSFDFKEAK